MTNHPARPGRRAQHVRRDLGGWISGPCADIPERTESLEANRICCGDVIVVDGAAVTVTAVAHERGESRLSYQGGSKSGMLRCSPNGTVRRLTS